MTPEETTEATKDAVKDLPGRFMLDPPTYQRGAELGFEGADFYTCGRGGALGEVHPDVVSASFVFFDPDHIATQWTRGGQAMSRADAVAAFTEALVTWSDDHLDGATLDWGRLGTLLTQVCGPANPAGAPLFAAWRAVTAPAEGPAHCLFLLNLLRELRNARHGAAVIASGLEPVEALMVHSPFMAGLFGWEDPPAAPEGPRHGGHRPKR